MSKYRHLWLLKTRPIPYRPRHDIAMNCIATPRGGKWRCCNVHEIEVYRSVTLGPGHKFFFLFLFSSLTHFYSQQILLFFFYLSPSPLLLFSLRPRNAFPLPLHLLQSFSHIFHFPQISFFIILYSIVLYWKKYKIVYMYWENPIQKNIVNPIPNTIAPAWL